MRRFFFLLFSLLLFTSLTWQQSIPSKANPTQSDIQTVNFCDLLANPQLYDQKVVRTTAIYSYGGEDTQELYCPECLKSGFLRVDFKDPYETCTKPKIADKLDRGSGTVRVVAVGKFHGGEYASQFDFQCVEKADIISKRFQLPEKLPTRERKKVRCE